MSRPVQIAVYAAVAVAAVLTVLYCLNRFVWFYRDPVRRPEATGRVIISPADGQVVYIKRFEDGGVYSEKLGRRIELTEVAELPRTAGRSGWIIGMYMSPFDVHFNYSPVAGTVTAVRYTKADANLPMVDLHEYIQIAFLRRPFDNFAAKFHLENERNTVLIQPGPGSVEGQPDVAAVEIADKFVNKIDVMVDEGQPIAVGDKLGFIKRGYGLARFVVIDQDDTSTQAARDVRAREDAHWVTCVVRDDSVSVGRGEQILGRFGQQGLGLDEQHVRIHEVAHAVGQTDQARRRERVVAGREDGSALLPCQCEHVLCGRAAARDDQARHA